MAAAISPAEELVEKWVKAKTTTPVWGTESKNGDHLWCRSSASGDLCYVGSSGCLGRGHRLKCTSCKIVIHTECYVSLHSKVDGVCRKTYHDAENGSIRESTDFLHHWIARKNPKGRCKTCSKTFGGKMCSLLNETIAMSCTWCKEVCHNKGSCYDHKKMSAEKCTLGKHCRLIVPSTWIVKLPPQESENAKQVFVVKPIPSTSSTPLLVFINPKSGGNQGIKLLRTFQWLLNPRQVFDLTQGGPNFGLELYKRVPNLRILACGGDGTVGWILSVLDALKICASPPIAVLPLGTGNDLARALGWGGGYTDEPLSKILSNIEGGEIVKLDRWMLNVIPNDKVKDGSVEEGRKNLPLTVVNNYFSIGVDALIALEFHEAREAQPTKFNSRLRNKMFYGQAGGKDLIQRKWKDLSNFVTLECDGQDMTGKLKELRVHAILFLNICSYGGGTRPWGAQGQNQFQSPRTDDGLIEVIGLTTYQLPLLQAGGHGSPIAQCRKAKLVTSCTVPVQVDGEPCRLMPSVIDMELLNTVNMIAKTKKHGASAKKESVEKISLPLKVISLPKYEAEHQRKEALRGTATAIGAVSVNYNTDLSEIRGEINKLLEEKGKGKPKVPGNDKSAKWWYIDSCSGEKFFRIDEAQDHLYYVSDICDEELFIVEEGVEAPGNDVTKAELRVGSDIRRVSTTSSISQLSPDSGDDGLSYRGERTPSETSDPQGEEDDEENREEGEYDEEDEEREDGEYDEEDDENRENDDEEYEGDEDDDRDEDDEEEGTSEEEESERSNFLQVPGKQKAEDKRLSISSFKIEESEMDIIAAAKMGNLNKLAQLHTEGHDLGERDKEGRTALHHAAFIGNVEVVRYLAAYAPISVLDAQDSILYHSALHRAATRKDKLICSILVSAGASLDLRDKQGHTAQELAEMVGDYKLATYLKSVSKSVIL